MANLGKSRFLLMGFSLGGPHDNEVSPGAGAILMRSA